MIRHLVVLDVDSTLIDDEVIELLAEAADRRAEVATITEAAMRGEIDFAESLRRRVATLRGVPTTVFADVARHVTPTRGAADLIRAVHGAGGAVAAVSGGFHEVLDLLAPEWNLDRWRANRLVTSDEELTGHVDGPIVDGAAKARTLIEWAQELGVPLARTVAIGDGANDALMLETAGLGVAFDAKPVLRRRADVVLPRRDLTGVLPLLGL